MSKFKRIAEKDYLYKIDIAGAKFDVMAENPDGTLSIRNDYGSVFDTEPDEPYTVIGEAPKQVSVPAYTIPLSEFLHKEREEHQLMHKMAVMEAEKELFNAFPLKEKLPVGISKLQWILVQNPRGQTQRSAMARYNVAVANSEVPFDERHNRKVHKTIVFRALEEGKPVPQEVLKDYPELIKESNRKFTRIAQADDGLEEFLSTYQPIYHGTPKQFDAFDTSISEGNATWFTTDKQDIIDNTAGAVQGVGQSLNIMERYLKPGLKLATPEQAEQMYTDQLIAEGYRGVRYPQEEYGDYEWIKLFNPNEDTLTKSQLVEMWNQRKASIKLTRTAQKQKQPWEMTKKEYREHAFAQNDEIREERKKHPVGSYLIGVWTLKECRIAHRMEVESALYMGYPVPKNVLKEYPDLAKQYNR